MSIHNRVSGTFWLLPQCLLTLVVLNTFLAHRWMPAAAGETVSTAEEFAWRETPASLALIRGQQVVWQFNHLQDGSERGVPYFHPLATLDGAVLTDLRPDDHLWHRGLRFAWKQINGLDGYWTWPEGLERFPEATGQTEVTAVRMTKGKDFSARFELELSYHPPGQPADLTEKRTILMSAPDAQGRYRIDWRGVFTAGARGAVLDRTPIPGQPDGKPWGGYAGLQLRLPRRENLAAWGLLNSEKLAATSSPDTVDKGKVPSLQELHGQGARWLEVSVELVDGKKAAAALFDHPGNLRHPAAWHASSMPNELIQTPLFHGPHTLAAGESLTFTYRILVSSERSEAGFLDREWQDFADKTSAAFIETKLKTALQAAKNASEPLRVHPTNPRYFTDGSGKAIYLTGSHTWNNLVDFGTDNPPKPFDFDAYLDFLERHHHNFIRLWRWEGVAFDTRPFPQYVQPGAENIIAPHPWLRTGPGQALDGLPKFDLSRFDPDYFDRLRTRVRAAGERGIYVSVMLFEGWELQHIANGWQTHPFHADNNVNGLNGDTDGDGRGIEINTLRHPAALKFQEDYVRKVIATVGDLDNVLYEISNESGAYSIEWQYHFIRFVKDGEKSREKSHPVGMTFPYSRDPQQRGKNADLFNSPADWISPNSDAGKLNYQTNPPPALGDKVVLADTDHLGGIWGNSKWVWQCFLRGHNPIFMDPYEHRLLGKGQPNQWDSVRQALGVTRRMAERIDLAQMTPVLDIASTKYCLANPGKEYLVYLPEGGEVTLDLEAVTGTLAVEWMHPVEGTITPGEVTAGGAKRQFKAPFAGDAVLYLATSHKT